MQQRKAVFASGGLEKQQSPWDISLVIIEQICIRIPGSRFMRALE